MREPSLFALGVGGSVAGTVGTAVVLIAPPPSLLVAAAAAVAVFPAATAVPMRLSTPERIERFQSLSAQVPVVVVPVILTAAVVTVHYGLAGPGRAVFWPGMIGVGVAFVGAVSILHAAERRYAARVEAESDVRVVLPDPSADGPGKRWQLVGVAAGVVAVALFLLSAVLGDSPDVTWLFAALGGIVPTLTARHRSELVVLDAGLKQGVAIRPWSDFESYEIADDELVIRDGSWFPQQYAIPREKIDDEDAAVAALSRYLPEK
jgi:hypothetical protein